MHWEFRDIILSNDTHVSVAELGGKVGELTDSGTYEYRVTFGEVIDLLGSRCMGLSGDMKKWHAEAYRKCGATIPSDKKIILTKDQSSTL